MLCKALLLLVLVSYVLATALSSSMQSQVLQRHNAKRAGVVPAASPSIPALVWDANLATVASNYANNCVWGHSTNGFGENLGAAYSSSGFIGEAQTLSSVDSWDNEKADYTLSSNTCAPGKVCGHYTQVVWANSVRLGCGYANCPANTNPFGSGTGWTISVCNYDPPGNYIGQKPYNAGTGSNSCTPSCPANACGTVTSSCGTPISCSCPSGSYCNGNTCATCTSPCTAGVCGLKNSTNCPSTQYNCGNCASGQACGSNNVCQATTPACTNTICTANGRTCGSFSDASCTGSVSCGTCASGQTCTNGVCVAPPCNGACSSPSQTCNSGSNTCSCSAGYSLVNNVCTVQSNSNPSWNNDFAVLSGSDTASVTGNALSIIGTSYTPSVVRFARSSAAINPYWTKATVEVTQTTGTFGFGFRIGDKNGYADDGVYVFATNIGTPSYGMSFDWKWYGGWENPSPAISPYSQSKWRTNGPMTVSSWMTKNDTTGLTTVYTKTAYTEIVNGFSSSYSACYGVSVYSSDLGPNTGSVAFYSKRSSGSTSISKFTLATATTLSVSLSSCINDADWIAMFRTLTGCSTCTVTARAVGENARCKAAGAKEAASAFIVVVESTTVASEAVAGSFLAAVESGSAAAAPLAVKSAAIIAGTEGAVLAGLPEAGVIVTAGGAAAGAGGGGAGGLSGGAIAGIVVGSVAGAVLIVGITAIVVAAVIVAAVVVAKKASDSDDESGPSRADPENNKRGSIRETIYNIFRGPRGGVDVMNNPAGGHQSITARAPKM